MGVYKEKLKSGRYKYIVRFKSDGPRWSYSDYKYGDRAKELADLAFKDKTHYGNLFKKFDNYVELYLWYKPENKFLIAYLDLDDFEKYKYDYWSIHKGRQTYYLKRDEGTAGSKKRKRIFIHNIIAQIKNSEENVIDHINGNGLDNRKCNLREIKAELNSKNITIARGNVPIVGINYQEDKKLFSSTYSLDGKNKSKVFPITNNRTAKEALIAACKYRNKMISECGYLCQPIDIDSLDLDAILEDLGLKDE